MPKQGQLIAGKYRLERCLGAGAMGCVWAALHLELDARVAIKFETPTSDGPRRSQATRQEARAAARLQSQHVVRVYDLGTEDGVPFIVMELLLGQSLKARLASGPPLSPADVSEVVRQTAVALDLAHDQRIVHRDIKPSNVFLTREGEREVVKVLDFGIAKWLDPDIGGEVNTESARVVGSAAYMSPEQARAKAVDARSDVWSLAVLAYEMLVGARPFLASNIPGTLSKICAGEYSSPASRLGNAYLELDAVFTRGLQLDPERRFQSAGAFARALDSAVQALPAPAAPRVPAEGASLPTFGRSAQTASLSVVRSSSNAARTPRAKLGWGLLLLASAVGIALWLESNSSWTRREEPGPSASETQTPARVTSNAAAPITQSQALEPPGLLPTPTVSVPTVEHSMAPVEGTRSPAASRATKRPALAPSPSASVAPSAVAPRQVDPTFGLEVPVP